MKKNFRQGSWQKVAPWYSRITNEGQGHYYHQHVVIPGVLKLLDLKPGSRLLDLACGNGVLGKAIPEEIEYTGVDIAPSLVNEAKRTDHNPKHQYLIADATKSLSIPNDFSHSAIILALQNIQNPAKLLQNASQHLTKDGVLVIVTNHPAFRIPRQSSWGIDESKKLEYRRVDRYMTPMPIPINMNPGDRHSTYTMSYHFPIGMYSKMLKDAGFAIEIIEEWTSDKQSEGGAARMENRSRSEFPLFLALKCFKKG